MMWKLLPDRIFPWQLAQRGQEIGGRVPLARMPRLVDALHKGQGEAKVELFFGCEGRGRCYVRGLVKSCPQLLCQRCLQPMEWPLDIPVRLFLAAAETEIKGWREGYEPWIVAWEEAASLWYLVEDELLLALPMVERHRADECPAGDSLERAAEEAQEEEAFVAERRFNPFVALKELKRESR